MFLIAYSDIVSFTIKGTDFSTLAIAPVII
jgi:hypothetical protein